MVTGDSRENTQGVSVFFFLQSQQKKVKKIQSLTAFLENQGVYSLLTEEGLGG